MARLPTPIRLWLLPVPAVTVADYTGFVEFARAGAHHVAPPSLVRHGRRRSWLAACWWRDPSAHDADRWQHRLPAGRLDQRARREFRPGGSAAIPQPREPEGFAAARRSPGWPAQYSATGSLNGSTLVGSPPGNPSPAEVNGMQPQRIGSAQQLRLLLPDADSAWPEDVWATLPEATRRDVLVQLAELLSRWLIDQERQA